MFTMVYLRKNFFSAALYKRIQKQHTFLKRSHLVFEYEHLEWKNLTGCCPDGAHAMLGCNSSFQALVKQLAQTSKSVYCMLYRQALAFKTLPDSIQTVLEQMIQIVSFIKAGVLNFLVFKKTFYRHR